MLEKPATIFEFRSFTNPKFAEALNATVGRTINEDEVVGFHNVSSTSPDDFIKNFSRVALQVASTKGRQIVYKSIFDTLIVTAKSSKTNPNIEKLTLRAMFDKLTSDAKTSDEAKQMYGGIPKMITRIEELEQDFNKRQPKPANSVSVLDLNDDWADIQIVSALNGNDIERIK